ncbi:hypothetical protein V1505DRAFT_219387 [Lipomyces doorenjongii]
MTSPDCYWSCPVRGPDESSPFGHVAYVANVPLETSEPIVGAHGRNIFHLMGNLSPYFPAENGFGVDECSLPEGTNITQMHMLQRRGARYPTVSEDRHLGIWYRQRNCQRHRLRGDLSFLNDLVIQAG